MERVGVFGEYYDKSKGKIIIVEKVWAVMVEREVSGSFDCATAPLRMTGLGGVEEKQKRLALAEEKLFGAKFFYGVA